MTKREVGELLRHVDTIYPGRIKLTPKAVEAWHFCLEEQDGGKVMSRLKRYAKENTYPPTIADLVEPPKRNYDLENPLENLARWEAEASGVTKH